MRQGFWPARLALAAIGVAVAFQAGGVRLAAAYPLDEEPTTGIRRLEAYRRAQGRIFPEGAYFAGKYVNLRLRGRPDFQVPPPDPEFSAQLTDLLGGDEGAYGIALLDLTVPGRPVYAAHNANASYQPGSIGKILIALGILQGLADAYPLDVNARHRVLKESIVTADGLIVSDDHTVPFWPEGAKKVEQRPIQEGDRANLYTVLDWMMSSSSNAAASLSLREGMMIHAFGRRYPPPPAEAQSYFWGSSQGELQGDLSAALHTPVRRTGLDPGKLRQGGFFTRAGKARVPSAGSNATPRELLNFMVRMEKGQIIDTWSSLEMKRLLYLTTWRIRFASSPVLTNSAVYFKSGSLFSCRAEAGFDCRKYYGNQTNYMNSMAVIETPERGVPLLYMVVIMSNVLRRNSADVHVELGTQIHRLIEQRHPVRSGGKAFEVPRVKAPGGKGWYTPPPGAKPALEKPADSQEAED